MVGVLVHVGRDQAALAPGLQNAEALFEDRPDLLKETAVTRQLAEVRASGAVVGLVPVRRAGDDKGDGAVLDERKIPAVAVDDLHQIGRREAAVHEVAAIAPDDVDVFPALIDTEHLAAEWHRGPGRRTGTRERVEDGFAVPTEELDETVRNLDREDGGMLVVGRVRDVPHRLGVFAPFFLGQLALLLDGFGDSGHRDLSVSEMSW